MTKLDLMDKGTDAMDILQGKGAGTALKWSRGYDRISFKGVRSAI